MSNRNKKYKFELTSRLSVNVTDEQMANYQKAARGVGLSQWVRDVLNAEIERLKQQEKSK